MIARAALAVLLAVPASAQDAASILKDSFGDAGLETLGKAGIVVLHGSKTARTAAAIHWKALDALSKASSSCLALAAAADALGNEPPPTGPDLGVAACRALPPEGLVTPSLHALAAALEARHEERWALSQAGAAPAHDASRLNALDTGWGRELVARRRADMVENASPLVKPLFDDVIAGPRPDKAATDLLVAEAKARGAAAPDVLVSRDASQGALSEELRAQVRRTLADERRRWAAEKARTAAAALLAKSSVKKELEDLRAVAKALSARANLPSALEAASARASAPASPRLRSAGLHLTAPVRLGQHELGDDALVSGAYWVDGLAEGASIDVEETIVGDTERGFLAPETRSFRRKNGGPYVLSRTLKIGETRPYAVRSIVTSGGAALAERVEVAVAKDFELALLKEADAAALRGSCRLKDAEAAYAALETLVADAAKVKPQYKALADRARKGKDASKADAENLTKLEEALADARADSSPQRCKYETGRVDAAISLAKRLPAGCDRDLPELHALRATIKKRAADQAWFLRASSDARSKRRSCDLDGARARWSEALAALEADPGARCGKAAEEEAKAKAEFAEAARELAWREQITRDLVKAESETSPARRLELVRPVTSRLGALDAACLKSEQRRATALAAAASKNLTAPPDSELASRLPADATLSVAAAEIRADRARRLEAATSVERALEPPVAKPEAAKAAPAPAKKAAVRPKRKSAEASR